MSRACVNFFLTASRAYVLRTRNRIEAVSGAGMDSPVTKAGSVLGTLDVGKDEQD